MIRIAGKIFGIMAIFFAALVLLDDVVVAITPAVVSISILFPPHLPLWICASLLALLFAGLSGFCNNTTLSIKAVILSTLYPLAAFFLGFVRGEKISAILLMMFSPYYLAIYLFAISGVIASVVKNRKGLTLHQGSL